MSFVIAAPQYFASAATDLAGIGSTISEAGTAAAAGTLGLLPAGADEVSAVLAALFDAHGQAYQALSAQAALFHEQFVQTLNAAGNAYASAEANAVQTMVNAVSTPAQAVSAAPGSPLQQLEPAKVGFNTNLVNNEVAFNRTLLTNKTGLEQPIFGTNGVINRGFNFGNLLVGTGEQTANSLLGAQIPAGFTAGLLTGSSGQVFNGGQIGGLAGAFEQQLAVDADLAGLATGGAPMQSLLSVVPAPVQALASSPSGLLQQVVQAQVQNTNLVSRELSSNQALVTNEVGMEKSYFGTDVP